jgi:hypothetical protein
MKSVFTFSTIAVIFLTSQAANAAEVVVNSVSGLPSATQWGTLPGENTGTAAITSTVARSGTGSLELTGDRTRTQLGIQYSPNTTNIGNLSDVASLTFDWLIAADSISGLGADYTPALRLLIQDGATRKELIWEGAYNGTYGNTLRDTWYTSGVSDLFYITGGDVNAGKTIADWAATLVGATVSGISVGAGSTAGASYHAFVDNVSLTAGRSTTTYNFEAAAAAVPEPATWAMMLLGFGAIGCALRRRPKVRAAISFA